ncbi:MAG: nuclear transport factor 2 family protein [Chloroflexota bacterium]
METVEGTVRAYFEALNRADVDDVVALFVEDGTFMANEAPSVTGHKQIRQSFEGHFREISFRREVHIDEIREGSEIATARTHTTGTLTFLAASNTVTIDSRELFVLRKTDGDWRITDYMFNRPASS